MRPFILRSAAILIASWIATVAPASAIRLDLISLKTRNLVYDGRRGVLLASVGSSEGSPYGNSIVRIDPQSRSVTSSFFAGSEPNRIALAQDGSVGYVGIDGARSIRSFDPGAGTTGPLISLANPLRGTYTLQNLAVVPGRPGAVAIAKDSVGSSGRGTLDLVVDGVLIGTPATSRGADVIQFLDSDTLISYNSSSSNHDLRQWDLVGDVLSQGPGVSQLLSGFSTTFEIKGGVAFGNRGQAVDPGALAGVGNFDMGERFPYSAVEAFPSLGIVYFLRTPFSSGGLPTLHVFDLKTFLQLDEFTFSQPLTGSVEELTIAGDGLAFRTSQGQTGFISGVLVPEPALSFLAIAALGFFTAMTERSSRSRVVQGAQSGLS